MTTAKVATEKVATTAVAAGEHEKKSFYDTSPGVALLGFVLRRKA